MRPDQWERARDIFGAAIEMDPPLRDRFVVEASAGDVEVFTEVMALLSADARHGRAPTTSAARAAAASTVPPAPGEPGRRFAEPLESQYADEYFRQSLPRVRNALVLAVTLYGAFGLLDNWIAPAERVRLWTIRIGVIIPTVAIYFYTYSARFQRHWQLLLVSLISLGALGIIAMVASIPPPGNHLYYAGLLLLTIYYCSLLRLSFEYAIGLSLIIFASYVTVAIAIATPGTVMFSNLMMLTSGNVIALSANFMLERNSRRDFLQRHEIRLRAVELDAMNRQLMRANRELVQSRAEIARSAEQNELLFAALTEALPGTILDGKYRLDEKIGSGGFGTVYRGYHLQLQRPVAVKLLRPTGGDMVADLARFRREGIAACRLRHPNAVQMLDFSVAGGSVGYLVMELLSGRSLAQEMQDRGPLPLPRCAALVQPLCAVLSAAHGANLVHRDLKPSNVFLHADESGETVKIIDFGLARMIESPLTDAISLTVSVIGTPSYMAPERLSGAAGDSKADIYSLGVMVHEMLAGETPALRGSQGAADAVHTFNRSETFAHPLVPAPLRTLIAECLSADPERRPTAEEFAERFLAAVPAPAGEGDSSAAPASGLGMTQ